MFSATADSVNSQTHVQWTETNNFWKFLPLVHLLTCESAKLQIALEIKTILNCEAKVSVV